MAKHICPKCGHDTFNVTAHVTQDWEVDSEGCFIDCLNDAVDITHRPDDDDLWTCAKCGFEEAGSEFLVKEEVQS